MTQTLLTGFVMGIGFALGASVYGLAVRVIRAVWKLLTHVEPLAG